MTKTTSHSAVPVRVCSALYGDVNALALVVTSDALIIQLGYAPPPKTVLEVHFQRFADDMVVDELVVRARVLHHRTDDLFARIVAMEILELVMASGPPADARVH